MLSIINVCINRQLSMYVLARSIETEVVFIANIHTQQRACRNQSRMSRVALVTPVTFKPSVRLDIFIRMLFIFIFSLLCLCIIVTIIMYNLEIHRDSLIGKKANKINSKFSLITSKFEAAFFKIKKFIFSCCNIRYVTNRMWLHRSLSTSSQVQYSRIVLAIYANRNFNIVWFMWFTFYRWAVHGLFVCGPR